MNGEFLFVDPSVDPFKAGCDESCSYAVTHHPVEGIVLNIVTIVVFGIDGAIRQQEGGILYLFDRTFQHFRRGLLTLIVIADPGIVEDGRIQAMDGVSPTQYRKGERAK